MSKGRILLVEDNASNRLLVHDLLEYLGYEVIEAADVQQGRTQLKQEPPPHLVLFDLHVPGGGGEVLLREIRETPTLQKLPVIAVTAFAMRGDKERFLRMGFNGYLSKPLDTRTFGDSIQGFLKAAPG